MCEMVETASIQDLPCLLVAGFHRHYMPPTKGHVCICDNGDNVYLSSPSEATVYNVHALSLKVQELNYRFKLLPMIHQMSLVFLANLLIYGSVLGREVCRLYRQKYQEKVHSLSPSSSLLQEIQVCLRDLLGLYIHDMYGYVQFGACKILLHVYIFFTIVV